MNIIINDKETLIKRLYKHIETQQYILDNKRDMFWSKCEMKNGRVIANTLKTVKKRFKEGWIDRYKQVLESLESNNIQNVDWIDKRDVLYNVGFEIDMRGEKSYKILRMSNKDIIINCKKDKEYFEKDIKRQLENDFR